MFLKSVFDCRNTKDCMSMFVYLWCLFTAGSRERFMYCLYVYYLAVPYLFISLHTVRGFIYFIVHEKINIVKERIEYMYQYLRKTALNRE